MPQFEVRIPDPDHGRISLHLIEGADAAAVHSALRAQGKAALSVKRVPAEQTTVRQGSKFDVTAWSRELHTLLGAGMTVVEALKTMDLRKNMRGRHVHLDVLTRLERGQPLSASLHASGAFPAILIANVVATERSGRLENALEDYLSYQAQADTLRRQVFSAALYPAIVVAVGLCISGFLLGFVMPRFARMYATFRGELSMPTRVLLAASRFMQDSLPLLIGGAVGLTTLGVIAWHTGLLGRIATGAVRLVPAWRRAREDFLRAKGFQSLLVMVRGGHPIAQALQVVEGLGLDTSLQHRFAVARAAIERGQPASTALAQASLLDPVGERLLSVGERSGQFETVLRTVAEIHSASFSLFLQRATRLIEPLLLLVVAVLVGGIVVLMYMPIFDVANSVG